MKFIEKTFKRTSHRVHQSGFGEYRKYADTDEATERGRFVCDGSKGMQVGDIIDARFPVKDRYKVEKVEIVLRYYTVNLGFKNYHARVKLLDGEHAGKVVSMRV